MKLNESQIKLIKDRLKSVWKWNRACHICTNTEWAMGSINETKEYNEGNHCQGAGITPMVQINCATCGNTIIFNAIWAMGSINETKEYNEGNHCQGAGITPMVQINCATCGNTIIFNAIALGVVDRVTGKVKEAKP